MRCKPCFNDNFRPDYDWNNNKEFTIVDSFNLQTMKWKTEDERFPFKMVGAAAKVPYGNTFITVGGLMKDEAGKNINVDFIYKVCRLPIKDYVVIIIMVELYIAISVRTRD